MVACGQTLKGDLWTNLGVWAVDKPWYLASVHIPVSGLWNSLSWWPVDRPWYLAMDKSWWAMDNHGSWIRVVV